MHSLQTSTLHMSIKYVKYINRNMRIPKWAREIHATRRDHVIDVEGKGHYPFPDFSVTHRVDSGRWIHIEFANADSDSELLDFVDRYGPVNGEFGFGELFPTSVHSRAFKRIVVEQPIQKLREAHSAIVPAVRLVATLQSEKSTTFEALNRLCCLLAPHIGVTHEADSGLNRSLLSRQTMNVFTEREMGIAAAYLCKLLDQFPPKLAKAGSHGVELPYYEDSGILPILYYLLRQDFLSDFRTIGICERCRRLFVVRRKAAQFCSAECSQLKRSLDYYHAKQVDRGRRKNSAK